MTSSLLPPSVRFGTAPSSGRAFLNALLTERPPEQAISTPALPAPSDAFVPSTAPAPVATESNQGGSFPPPAFPPSRNNSTPHYYPHRSPATDPAIRRSTLPTSYSPYSPFYLSAFDYGIKSGLPLSSERGAWRQDSGTTESSALMSPKFPSVSEEPFVVSSPVDYDPSSPIDVSVPTKEENIAEILAGLKHPHQPARSSGNESRATSIQSFVRSSNLAVGPSGQSKAASEASSSDGDASMHSVPSQSGRSSRSAYVPPKKSRSDSESGSDPEWKESEHSSPASDKSSPPPTSKRKRRSYKTAASRSAKGLQSARTKGKNIEASSSDDEMAASTSRRRHVNPRRKKAANTTGRIASSGQSTDVKMASPFYSYDSDAPVRSHRNPVTRLIVDSDSESSAQSSGEELFNFAEADAAARTADKRHYQVISQAARRPNSLSDTQRSEFNKLINAIYERNHPEAKRIIRQNPSFFYQTDAKGLPLLAIMADASNNKLVRKATRVPNAPFGTQSQGYSIPAWVNINERDDKAVRHLIKTHEELLNHNQRHPGALDYTAKSKGKLASFYLTKALSDAKEEHQIKPTAKQQRKIATLKQQIQAQEPLSRRD